MAIRVGINGFGRIGRNFFRAQQQLGADTVSYTHLTLPTKA